MKNTNPARGTRDFLPNDLRKREYVIGVIKRVYEKYGFEPLETPAFENLSTLTNKYGEEGDQLMYKLLKRGEKLTKEIKSGAPIDETRLTDLALRYDLTVPLARVVANYQSELPKFFKRYQIQPVWRADRPAKGRYREFYQCDVDSIGSRSMIIEAELILAVSEILTELGFADFQIRANNRGFLKAMVNAAGIPKDRENDAFVALDKIEKIGREKVVTEMEARGIDINAAFKFIDSASLIGFDEIIGYFKTLGSADNAVNEFTTLFTMLKNISPIVIDLTLARGLSYYTGAIFEVVLTNGDFSGSIAGGGRYDGLIGMFGKDEIPAAGISLGLERIIYVMEERGMFPEQLTLTPADILVTIWNDDTIRESLSLAAELRAIGLRVMVYPDSDKLGKQLKYADMLGINRVCIVGENEIEAGTITVKDLKKGEQKSVTRERLSKEFSKREIS